ncbi:hypothetical protein [Haloarchaeobius litoreus]|uniref:Holin n=1 Tax=Haloarchaeobius litoreus TaxID=755306 RepID=A0ABD6DKR4_9EURY|nr:hypothetical protein [Haloarchaeobius litoreus]
MSEVTMYEKGRDILMQAMFIGSFCLIGILLADAIAWLNPLASAIATGSIGSFVWRKEQQLLDRKLGKGGAR